MERLPRPRSAAAGGWLLTAALLSAPALAGSAAPAAAQGAEPFSRLDVSAAGAVNVNRERLHQYWSVQEGGVLRVATPFYLGSVALSAQYIPFASRDSDLQSFHATAVAVDWGMEWLVGSGIRGSAGLQFGNMRFSFVEPQTGKSWPESEVFVGARAGLGVPLRGRLGLTAAASHQRVLTHLPFDLTFATVGLNYSLDTPRWLREFLQ